MLTPDRRMTREERKWTRVVSFKGSRITIWKMVCKCECACFVISFIHIYYLATKSGHAGWRGRELVVEWDEAEWLMDHSNTWVAIPVTAPRVDVTSFDDRLALPSHPPIILYLSAYRISQDSVEKINLNDRSSSCTKTQYFL